MKPVLCYGSVPWTQTQMTEPNTTYIRKENIKNNLWPSTI